MARFKTVDGFTILEVMTCVSILTIMCVVAIPLFIHWRQHNQFTAQVRRVKNILVLGRSTAVNENTQVEICPSIHHRSCDCQGDWSKDILVHELNGHVLSVMAHSPQLRINYRGNLGHNDRLIFGSLGATLGQQGSFFIAQGGQRIKLTVNSAGRIREYKAS